MKKSIAVLCIISFLSLSGCATLFKGTSEKVNMESSPVRADVYVNGQFMGKTPMQLNLAVKRSYAIEFRAKGYQSRTYHINNVDAATGAWYHLDQKNIDAVLVEQQP